MRKQVFDLIRKIVRVRKCLIKNKLSFRNDLKMIQGIEVLTRLCHQKFTDIGSAKVFIKYSETIYGLIPGNKAGESIKKEFQTIFEAAKKITNEQHLSTQQGQHCIHSNSK